MGKCITFCKSNLWGVLFALCSAFNIALALCGALYFEKFVAGFVIVAICMQAVFGIIMQKHSAPASVLRLNEASWAVLFTLAVICALLMKKIDIIWGIILVLIWIFMQIFCQDDKIVSNVSDSEITENLPNEYSECTDFDALQQKHIANSDLCDEFDLLCEVKNKKVRLPFSQRNEGKLIGIFPLKYNPFYLEHAEVENKRHSDKDVDERRLLDEGSFCSMIAKVKDRMNDYLQELGYPILDGIYLADSTYMQGCGWLVGFEKGKTDVSSDYYGGNEPAKLRYMGYFKGKCKK